MRLQRRHDDLSIMPEWVFDRAGAPEAANENEGVQSHPLPPNPVQRQPDSREMAYGRRVLDQECVALAMSPPGGRNAALNEAAFTVATLFESGVINEGEARIRLFAGAEACGLVRDDGARQTRATIASGFRTGRRRPRGVPEPEPAGGAVLAPSPAAVDAAFDGLVWDDEAAEDVAVEWLVKGLIPRQGVGLMPGQSTMGKSFAAMDLAGAIATGLPWFGRKTRMRGGTLLLLGEAVSTVRPRMTALREKLRPSAVDAETGEVRFSIGKLPIVWGSVTNLTAAAALAEAEALVRKVSAEMEARFGVPLRLVIIDTALAAFLFPEDPDASQVQLAMNGMKRLGEACDGFAIATHHHGKSVEAGAVGSFMWRGAVDIELSVTGKKLANGDVKDRKIKLEKNRHGPTGEVGGFELVKVEVGRDEDGDSIIGAYITPKAPADERTSAAPAVSGQSSRAFRVFLECVGGALASHGVEGRPYGPAGALVRAVTVDEVRVLFRVAYAPGGRPEGHADAIRKAFNRSLENARLSGRLGFREADGIATVWEAGGFMTTAERHALQGLDPHQTAA